MKVSRKSALLGMLAAGVTGCAGATSGALPGLLNNAPAPGGRAPSDAFVVRKGRGVPKASTRRINAVTAGGGGGGGGGVFTYTDSASGYSAQANQSTGAANLYAPNGTFAAQFTTAAVSGGYALTLTHASGNNYTCSMPDPNNVPTGTSTYNGVTLNIDPNAGLSTATYGNATVTASYDASTDSVTANLPDGTTAVFPNVTGGPSPTPAPSPTAVATPVGAHTLSPSAHDHSPEQAARAVLCLVRILVAIIITIITLVVIYYAIRICATWAGTLFGLILCLVAIVIAIIYVVITIMVWIFVWVVCFRPVLPPPGPIAAQPVGAMPAQAAAS
ncbi:MAG: hypothetical protein JOZ86_05915 [Candidatus Eremiobacteraeota bacterium]|nr:hypothetical protein [Candidatus Eremiobacteraeota bacterium]